MLKFKNNLIKNFNSFNAFNYFKKIKSNLKEYGIFGLYFYCFSYIATGIVFYYSIKYKLINSQEIISKLPINANHKDKVIEYVGKDNTDLGIAILFNEMFELIRLPAVILILPYILRKFKKK